MTAHVDIGQWIAAFAAILNVTPRTVLRWAESGRFPHAVLGRVAGRESWVIPEEDVKAAKR